MTKFTKFASLSAVALMLATPSLAQEAEEVAYATAADTAFIFNTLLFLIGGFLVMWMAAGFAMLEAGLVRSKNVTMQLTKNVALFAIAAVMFMLVGYNIMYPSDWIVENWFGEFGLKTIKDGASADDGYSAGSDFFFQLMFCATTASIVSGTLAERIKLWPFLIFTVVLTGFIYPIEASWQWGTGWLSDMGFSDFAGSTLVHAAGGAAALAGAILLGARKGKYVNGQTVPILGSNMPLAALGTFILWLGWFGFNGGSQLAMGTIENADAVAQIFANTNTAAAGGAIAAMILTQVMYGKIDLTMMLNGALAGLVSITAEPLTPSLVSATLIGGVGGVIVVFAVPFFDKLKIDDVVGAISVHGVAGIWGTLAVALNTQTDYENAAGEVVSHTFIQQLWIQFVGTASICVFVFVSSFIVWSILKSTMGIRVTEEAEMDGLDMAELGMEAYPEFRS